MFEFLDGSAIRMMQQKDFGIPEVFKGISPHIFHEEIAESALFRQARELRSLLKNTNHGSLPNRGLFDALHSAVPAAFTTHSNLAKDLLAMARQAKKCRIFVSPVIHLKSWNDSFFQARAYSLYDRQLSELIANCRQIGNSFNLGMAQYVDTWSHDLYQRLREVAIDLAGIDLDALEKFWLVQHRKVQKLQLLREIHTELKAGRFQKVDFFLERYLKRRPTYSLGHKARYRPEVYEALLLAFERLWKKPYREIKVETVHRLLKKSVRLDSRKIWKEAQAYGFQSTSMELQVRPEYSSKDMPVLSGDKLDDYGETLLSYSCSPENAFNALLEAEWKQHELEFLDLLHNSDQASPEQHELTLRLKNYLESDGTALINFSEFEPPIKYNLAKRAKRLHKQSPGDYFRGAH